MKLIDMCDVGIFLWIWYNKLCILICLNEAIQFKDHGVLWHLCLSFHCIHKLQIQASKPRDRFEPDRGPRGQWALPPGAAQPPGLGRVPGAPVLIYALSPGTAPS